MRGKGRLWLLAGLLAPAFAAGCGYHLAGHSQVLPKTVQTIAVPAFENGTMRYRIEQRLTEATIREFLARSKYRIVSNAAEADATVRGKVTAVETTPLLFDTATGRPTAMLVTVRCQVWMVENATKKELYRNDNFFFRNQYEISTDVASFFEEQDPALDRLAREFSSRLVAAILEGF